MPSLLPLLKSPRLTVKSGLPATASLDRYDAVLLLLPTDARPSGGLPNASRWQTLHALSKVSHADVRSVTLDNKRQTLGVLGYCRKDAEAFELLRVAGLLAQRTFANRPQPARIAVVVQAAGQQRAVWQEVVYAALAAHCFHLPTDKLQTGTRKALATVDVFGDSQLDRGSKRESAGSSFQVE
jgi:hypothetical protein